MRTNIVLAGVRLVPRGQQGSRLLRAATGFFSTGRRSVRCLPIEPARVSQACLSKTVNQLAKALGLGVRAGIIVVIAFCHLTRTEL